MQVAYVNSVILVSDRTLDSSTLAFSISSFADIASMRKSAGLHSTGQGLPIISKKRRLF